MTISCIMTAYNAEPFVEEAVRSILQQDYADFEFVIVNDGSTDATGRLLDDLARSDSRIHLMSHENLGPARSLNRAVAATSGRYVARMDADDVAHPSRFRAQIDALDADRTLVAVGTLRETIDAHGRTLKVQRSHKPRGHNVLSVPPKYETLVSPSSMVRGDLLRAMGFRSFFRYAQDTDLWLRLAERGRLGVLPHALIRYRTTGASVSIAHAVEQQTYAAIAVLSAAARKLGREDLVTDNSPLDMEPFLAHVADRVDASAFRLWVYERLLRRVRQTELAPDTVREARAAARLRLADVWRPDLAARKLKVIRALRS